MSKQVKFISNDLQYVKGDIAVIKDDYADELIRNGKAVSAVPFPKSLDYPPKDKMVRRGEIKTK